MRRDLEIGSLDLSRLMGGQALEVPCMLAKNGSAFRTLTLIDTGANGFLFIDTALADSLIRHFNVTKIPLPQEVPITGYDGQRGTACTHYLRMTFIINGRRFVREPFLIAPLGRHDIILGRKWMSHYHVNPEVRLRKLIWPSELPIHQSFDRIIEIPRNTLFKPLIPNPQHQLDADKRDAALLTEDRLDIPCARPYYGPVGSPYSEEPDSELTEKPTYDLQDWELQLLRPDPPEVVRNLPLQSVTDCKTSVTESLSSRRPKYRPANLGKVTHTLETAQSLRRMAAILEGSFVPEFTVAILKRPKPPSDLSPAALPTSVDIFAVSAVAYNLVARRPNHQAFTASLDELDSIINGRLADANALVTDEASPVDWQKAADIVLNSIDYTEDEELVAKRLQSWPKYQLYQDVFSKRASDLMPPYRKHVDHKIELIQENTLSYSPLYRMTTEELLAVKQYLLDNLDKGFIAPSNAPFASPVLFVAKPDGGLRFCIDFRKLNSLTRKDQHPLPLIDETLARISKAKIFTKLDIRQAFHRIRMDPASEELTTFRTRYGTYKCKVLPFGLTNGPATYQRYMNTVLFDYLDDFCTAYLDDILIYSDNELEHQEHVCKVLQRLRKAGLQVDIKKTEFHVTRTKYLGFIISIDGIEVDPDKVSAVVNWKAPASVKGVQSFLGFCNFYRRFIKDYGRIAKPLNELTRKDTLFRMTTDCIEAFRKLQQMLVTAPILCHFQPELETQVETDASDGVIAGVMSQKHPDDQWRPVGYFSKTMAPAELNYPIHDKEMLAIVRSLQQWRADLARTDSVVRVWTDHKALEYFMTTKQLNQRQARWAEVLSEFYFQVCYRPGSQNPLADALSRREQDFGPQESVKKAQRTQILLPTENVDPQITASLSTELSPMELEDLAPVSLLDRLLTANKTSQLLADDRDKARRGEQDWSLEGGLLLWRGRLVVPDDGDLRTRLLDSVHSTVVTAHPGISKTVILVARKYYWKGLRDTIERYIANCHACKRSTVPRDKAPGMLHPLPVPQRPWQHLSMDYKSFPVDKHGYDCLFVVMDRFSKQSVSIPCYKTVTARDMAELFLKYIWCREGFPDSIVSDRGPQFVSSFWKEVCRILGIQIKLSTAFHPQTDGQTEIMNQYIDQRLRPFVNYYMDNWSELIPMMDYAQLTLPHDSIRMSPFELLKGYQPRTHWDWNTPTDAVTVREKLNQGQAVEFAARMHSAWKTAKDAIIAAQAKKQRDVNKHRRPVDFDVEDQVYVSTRNWVTDRPSRKLADQMAGPFPIQSKQGHSFEVGLPQSMKIHNVFSTGLLRKAATDPLPGQVNEPAEPINVTGQDEWEVQEIIAVRKACNQLKYRAKWLGADDDPEWYPASDFMYSPQLLRDFHLANPTLPGPPKALLGWIKAWEDGIDNYDNLEDNTAMNASSRTSFFERGG